jgi:hypothetical protein
MGMKNVLESYIGQKIAVLAARYQYRGIMHEVSDDHLTLANATAVEISGPNDGNVPNTEDPIGGSVHISLNAIEIVYQPNWVFAPLPGE